MAGEADNPLLVREHACIITAVNAMTRKAHPACERHMIGTALGFCHKVTMTFAAELRAFSIEQLLFI
jgi:hypothetical protein